MNSYNDIGNSSTLASIASRHKSPACLVRVAEETVRIQEETGYPQTIILSGVSGSGKTHNSMILLRSLFDIAGGGPGTDFFKHLSASLTVLKSLGSARTPSSRESSRIVSGLLHLLHFDNCNYFVANAGTLHRNGSERGVSVQKQDTLLLPGPE